MLEILCQTEKDMQRLGQSLGACMRAGDVVLLTGEMGAGKSVLTRAAGYKAIWLCCALLFISFCMMFVPEKDM